MFLKSRVVQCVMKTRLERVQHRCQRVRQHGRLMVLFYPFCRSTAWTTHPATAPTGCPLSTCQRDATDWETRPSLFGWVLWTHTRTHTLSHSAAAADLSVGTIRVSNPDSPVSHRVVLFRSGSTVMSQPLKCTLCRLLPFSIIPRPKFCFHLL